MMTNDSYTRARYNANLPSRKPESKMAYDNRWTLPTMNSARPRSTFPMPPSYPNSRCRSPRSTVQGSEFPVSVPEQYTVPRSLIRAADLLKTRPLSPVKSRLQPQPEQSSLLRMKRVVSNRIIPFTEFRRRNSDIPSPASQGDPIILSDAHRDLRPVRSLRKSCPASGRGHSSMFAPMRKRSVSIFREPSIPSNLSSPVLNRRPSPSCMVGQRSFVASGQGHRPHLDVTFRAEYELVKEAQDQREKLQAIENKKRSQETRMHQLLSEQWKTMEVLLKEKCAIINQIKATKSQSLGEQGEERLIKLLEKQEECEEEIQKAESELREISDKVINARQERNRRLKEEMRTLKNMENTLIHQRKWSLLQRAIKQAMSKFHKVSRAANDLGGQILSMFQLRKEFYEKYDDIVQQKISKLIKARGKKKFSSVDDKRKAHQRKADFSESETLVALDKLASDMAELQKLVYSNDFLCDAQNGDIRIKNLVPKDPIVYPIPLHIKNEHDRLRLCEIALKKFVDITNASDANKLWKAFKDLEKENVELLQSVHDLNIRNHEMYSEDEDQALKVALSRHKDGLETLNLLQKKIKLQSKLEAMSEECEKFDSTCDEGTELILAVMQKIDKILRITGCYSLAKYSVFGTHRPLTYENVAKYLAVLKERVREIFQLYNYHVKNASSLQKNKESQNVFANDGIAISSSSPLLKTKRLLTEKESPIACPSHSSDAPKTPLGKRRKTLAEMQAEIDAVRKQNRGKNRVLPQMGRVMPKGGC